jgi:tetratricopeptide (TPR) repeat protein
MKRILMISVGLAMALQTSAQADVTSAYNANKQGDFAKAAEYIEKAINDPKAVTKEKTWRYRGDIYLSIAGQPQLAAQFPNAVQICKESYFKSMEIDTKKEWIQENTAGLSSLQTLVLENAGKQYEGNDFCGASGNFGVARDISTRFGIVDSAAIYNGAYCAERCGKTEEALAGYQESAKIGYNVPGVYGSIVELYNKMGKKEEAVKTLSDARAKYPKDSELLRAEVNVYLTDQKYDQALGLLKDLTAQDPSNEMIWFVLGVTYEKLGKVSEQEAAYLKALEINPKYFDALFNLGATYYNQGVEKYKECDKIPPREAAKYDACVNDANTIFAKSIGYFETAYNERPTDKDIINALKEAYVRVGNMEGKKKMEEALKGL